MRNDRLIGNLLFCMTILALPLSFAISCEVGEVDIFSIAGFLRYSWIMYLFIPVGIGAIIVGRQLKKVGAAHKKLYVIAWICIPLLLIFGSFRFIFQEVTYDVDNVCAVEEKINIDLPDSIQVVSHDFGEERVSYVKITDAGEVTSFAEEIRTNKNWTTTLSTSIKGMLPVDIQVIMSKFDYFLFYDLSTGRYNVCPSTEPYNCVFIAYDCELQRMIILDGLARMQ